MSPLKFPTRAVHDEIVRTLAKAREASSDGGTSVTYGELLDAVDLAGMRSPYASVWLTKALGELGEQDSARRVVPMLISRAEMAEPEIVAAAESIDPNETSTSKAIYQYAEQARTLGHWMLDMDDVKTMIAYAKADTVSPGKVDARERVWIADALGPDFEPKDASGESAELEYGNLIRSGVLVDENVVFVAKTRNTEGGLGAKMPVWTGVDSPFEAEGSPYVSANYLEDLHRHPGMREGAVTDARELLQPGIERDLFGRGFTPSRGEDGSRIYLLEEGDLKQRLTFKLDGSVVLKMIPNLWRLPEEITIDAAGNVSRGLGELELP
jgi:hypothetical protein